MSIPIVAIIGRPNVGKSTLFNRLIRRPVAITHDQPGVTRDRNAFEFEWNGRAFMLVDTGGFVASSKDEMERAVTEQSLLAIEEADVVLFLVDVKSGITDLEESIRDVLVRIAKPMVLAVTKVDRNPDEADMYGFYNLGLGDPHPVSGTTGRGTGDLLDAVVSLFPPETAETAEIEKALKIAIIGRPNVGKSSLVNALAGKKAVVVSPTPGTTRDSTDTHLTFDGRKVILVDTAGLKKITRLKESLEYYSALRTLRSLSRCDVAVVIIDINEGLTSYDKSLVDDAEKAGKGVIIAANKWDLVAKDTMTLKHTEQEIRDALPDKEDYAVIFISAKTGQRVRKVLELADSIDKARKFRVPTAELNRFFETMPIPPGAGEISIKYGTQHSIEPPAFVIFVSDPLKVKDNFVKYTERSLRRAFGFEGTPIKLVFKR
ncbi:MAG: ribosome biogenesis GTPase Der [Candidatus Latescibacter sp.]|nr:ribosome biogenesis GTPase Der [Candidatus Latescibacter sp.]